MTALAVPCDAIVRVTVTAPARHRCPFRDELDDGTVRVSWNTSSGQTIELHELSRLIRASRDSEISHEQWTADLVVAITGQVNVSGLEVASEWTTAGASVAVLVADSDGAL